MNKVRRVMISVLFALAVSAIWADELKLAENGITDYSIVLQKDAPAPIREWAGFLAKTLTEITGAKFPIITIAERTGNPAIVVAPNLGLKGFERYVIRTSGKDLILAGSGSRGVALAIRRFLIDACGCRWYDGWTRKIPKQSTLLIPELNVNRVPTFAYRRIFVGSGWGGDPEWKPSSCSTPRLPGEVFGRPGEAHTFHYFTRDWPADRLDLLSMSPEGKRRPFTGKIGPNMCMTNPDGRARVKKTLRRFIAEDRRDAKAAGCEPPFIYCLCVNDCAKYLCHCPECDKFQAVHGESGLLLDFVNDVARDIAPDFPELLISTDAYAYTEEPPKSDIKAEPNVIIEVTRTKQNYYCPVEKDTDELFVGYYTGWERIARHLGIWDYWVFYWDTFPAPYHNVHLIKQNLKWYQKHKTLTAKIESEQPNTASFRSLKEWLGGELMIDIDLDDKALIADFMNGFYGAAAPEMTEFMNILAERQQGKVGKVFVKQGVYGTQEKVEVPRREWLDADFYAKAEELFNRAEAKVAGADEQTRLNVARERVPVDLSLIYVYTIIKPRISFGALVRRYLANREAQYRLRLDKSYLNMSMMKIREEVEKVREHCGIPSDPANDYMKAPPREHDLRMVEPQADGSVKISFDLTEVTFSPKPKGVEVKWICREKEMDNIHARYDEYDWNLFSGDSIDFSFSPYLKGANDPMPSARYRFMMNPSGAILTAYDGSRWGTRQIVTKRELKDDRWTSEWFIPYIALASFDKDQVNSFSSLLPTRYWIVDVQRARAATGYREVLRGGQTHFAIPAEYIEGQDRVAIDRGSVVDGEKQGEVKVCFQLIETLGKKFEGRAKLILYSGKKRKVFATQDVSLEAYGTVAVESKLELPKEFTKFAVTIAVADENNKVIRTGSDLKVKNPWME